jgi:hypothetical protein
MQIRSVVVLAALGLAASPALTTRILADAPGMLLYTSPPAGIDVHRMPFKPFRSIGRSLGAGTQPVLPLIGQDGRIKVFAATGSPLSAAPETIVAPEEVVYTILGFCMARSESGMLWTWGSTVPSWMPREPMKKIDAGRNAVGGITIGGELLVWNLAGPLSITGKTTGLRSLSLGVDWGAALSTDGTLRPFGFGADDAIPDIQASAPLREISVDGIYSLSRAVAIDANGSLVSLIGTLDATGSFKKVSASIGRLAALDDNGVAWAWTWNESLIGWVPTQPLPGVFADVSVTTANTYLILDSDADRDGTDDSSQILRGELPDINGDMIDDRNQSSSVLFDEDGNGKADRAESSGTGERRMPSGTVWVYNAAGSPATICFAATARVPVSVENLQRVTLHHAAAGTDDLELPPKGLDAEFALWADPSGDGNPDDALLIRSYPIVLSPTGRTVVDLGGVSPGPPGAVFFQSLTYDQPANRRYGTFQSTIPASHSDPLRSSRLRGRSWARIWLGDDAPPTRTARVRELASYGQIGITQSYIPHWTAVWGDRLAGDCDGDGVLDSTVTGSSDFAWSPDVDLDNNGIVDSCEQDCDADAQYDVTEILAGEEDCDRDLLPDSCEPTFAEKTVDAVAPSANAPIELAFSKMPPAGGDVSLTVEVSADLGAPTEFLLLQFPGLAHVALFATTGRDCPPDDDVATRTISATAFNAARSGGDLRFTISASSFVSASECPTASMRVSLTYPIGIEDCDQNGVEDACQHGWAEDCDGDGVPDSCQIGDSSLDVDGNGVLDRCERDCNANDLLDRMEIMLDPSLDCDKTGYLDACEFVDCNQNGLHDPCELQEAANDCNRDGILDACQELPDCNDDDVPDSCQSLPDCDGDGEADACEVSGGATDKDGDLVPDDCEYRLGDFDLDDLVGPADLAFLLAAWGLSELAIADLDGDGTVGAGDLTTLLANWGPTGL